MNGRCVCVLFYLVFLCEKQNAWDVTVPHRESRGVNPRLGSQPPCNPQQRRTGVLYHEGGELVALSRGRSAFKKKPAALGRSLLPPPPLQESAQEPTFLPAPVCGRKTRSVTPVRVVCLNIIPYSSCCHSHSQCIFAQVLFQCFAFSILFH